MVTLEERWLLGEGTDERGRGGAPDRPSTSRTGPNIEVSILRVAWLAILLGLAMEGLLLLLDAGFGVSQDLRSTVADFVRNVSWSVFVCGGLAVGATFTQARVPAMGLFGLFFGPLAFELSRVFHRGTLEALGASVGGGGADLSPFLIALVKGLEYGCLGLVVGWVGARPWGGLAAHVAVGLAVGVVFGGTVVALMLGSTTQTPADVLSQGLNELLFPAGCSVVLFSASVLEERIASRG